MKFQSLFGLTIFMTIILLACQNPPPFLNPPQVIENPGPRYAKTSRAFQGIPSLAISPGGRLWATWYAGKTPKEDKNNYVVVVTSGDSGHSWQNAFVIDPDGTGPVRAFDPELWVDPDGRLWAFWAQAIGHDATIGGVWARMTAHPDSANPAWTAPRRLTDGVMMCKPTVLSTSEWILPASTWAKTDSSARVVVSTDHGQSWQVRGACHVPQDVRTFDEHMIIERRDQSLWMLLRTRYGIGESFSTDRGRTWTEAAPSQIQHPSARFFIRKLLSGNLLLVKHGPIHEQTGRAHLTAYLSQDDGQTWSGGLLLDKREGVSYPDGQQTADGLIHIIYDFDRRGEREILLAKFTEADVLQGKLMSKNGILRMRVCKAGE